MKNVVSNLLRDEKVISVVEPFGVDEMFYVVELEGLPKIIIEFWKAADMSLIFLTDGVDDKARGDVLNYWMGSPEFFEPTWVDDAVMPALKARAADVYAKALKDQADAQTRLIDVLKEENSMLRELQEKSQILEGLYQFEGAAKDVRIQEQQEMIEAQTEQIKVKDLHITELEVKLDQQKKVIDGQRDRLLKAEDKYNKLVEKLQSIDEAHDGDSDWFYDRVVDTVYHADKPESDKWHARYRRLLHRLKCAGEVYSTDRAGYYMRVMSIIHEAEEEE